MPNTNNEYYNYQFGKRRRSWLTRFQRLNRVAVADKWFRFQRLVSDVISRKAHEIVGDDIVTTGNEESCPRRYRNFMSKTSPPKLSRSLLNR